MTETTHRPFYWERTEFATNLPPGGELAALRRGIGRQPGEVPAMWKFYRTRSEDGLRRLAAEHHALVLFGVHQQREKRLVHHAGASIGEAVRQLHARFAEAAVDRRFFAAATASTLEGVTYHLRQLLRQTHDLPQPTPIDYTRLYWDLAGWDDPERRRRAQRRWGLSYYRSPKPGGQAAGASPPEGE